MILEQWGDQSLASHGFYDPVSTHEVTIPPTNAVLNFTVYPANLPQLGQPQRFSASQFGFNVYGVLGNNYTVQYTTALGSGNWPTVTVISNLPWSPYFLFDQQATNGSRFYRAVQGP